VFSNFFFSQNLAVYEVNVGKNIVQQEGPQNTAHARGVLGKSGYKITHSEYVTLIAFPLQQWLHERASVLLYTHSAWLVTVFTACCKSLFRHCGQTHCPHR